MGVLRYLGECDLAYGDNTDRLCAWDGVPLTGRRTRWCSDACGAAWGENHSWTQARWRARQDAKATCVWCGTRGMVEVDHIEAARGTHSVNSCLHHQSNLRVLCVACHRQRTREQRRPAIVADSAQLALAEVAAS